LVLVVKPLARLADLVTVPVAARSFFFTRYEWAGILEAEPMARILVIDDDPDLRAVLEEILKPAGYEVILAADGREGVMRHRTSPADLVITDLYMPIQDGFETIRELRSCFPEVAIIAMSGRTDTGTMLSIAQNLAAVGILKKPFLTDELIASVANALGGQSPAR
jgi:DNA-binding response OmpR family regulator